MSSAGLGTVTGQSSRDCHHETMASAAPLLPGAPAAGAPASPPAPAGPPPPAAPMKLSRRLCIACAGVVAVPLLCVWWLVGVLLTLRPLVSAPACAGAVVLTYAVRAAMSGGGAAAWQAVEGAGACRV